MISNEQLSKLAMRPVPSATATYSPISNLEIHDTIIEEADRNGFEVNDLYVKTKSGTNCIAMYGLTDLLQEPKDSEIGIRVGFKNSYDRTMSFGFALGSVVFICGNGMVSGEYTIKKRHSMRDIDTYAKELIREYFGQVRGEHERNLKFMKDLKQQTVTEKMAKEIVGGLFINNRVINQSQLREMTRQMYASDKFNNFGTSGVISGWDLYNHGTEALKSSANGNSFAKHIGYNEYFREFFGL